MVFSNSLSKQEALKQKQHSLGWTELQQGGEGEGVTRTKKNWESIDVCGRFPPFAALFLTNCYNQQLSRETGGQGKKGEKANIENKSFFVPVIWNNTQPVIANSRLPFRTENMKCCIALWIKAN